MYAAANLRAANFGVRPMKIVDPTSLNEFLNLVAEVCLGNITTASHLSDFNLTILPSYPGPVNLSGSFRSRPCLSCHKAQVVNQQPWSGSLQALLRKQTSRYEPECAKHGFKR